MSCNQYDLNLIAQGEDGHEGYVETLAHVEYCQACQRRLEQLYEEDASGFEVAGVLKSAKLELGAVDDTWLFEGDFVAIADQPREPDLESLESATHPELLGRIGRYDIERVVGVGGMGTVFKAYDTELHRVVAIKVLARHLAHNNSGRQRFAREARAAAAVLHPNVLPIYNVEANARCPFLVMQYVPGESLQSRVERSGVLPLEQVLRIALQTSSALAAAHQQGLVHRDVKPSNILLEDETDRVVLSDFGLARAADDVGLTCTGVVAGTPRYMSPEQATGEAIDHRSDLFSFGSVVFFMLTGRPPFEAANAVSVLHRICKYAHPKISAYRDDIPREVVQVVDRLLAKKPQQRFASAEEVCVKFERLVASCHNGSSEKSGRRRLSLSTRVFTVAAVLVAGIVLAFSFAPQSEPTSGRQNQQNLVIDRQITASSKQPKPEMSVELQSEIASATQAADTALSELKSNEDEIRLQRLFESRSVYEAIEAGYASDITSLAQEQLYEISEINSLISSLEQQIEELERHRLEVLLSSEQTDEASKNQ